MKAAHIDELKRELNAHVERLHKVYGCGLSVYDCFVRYSEIDILEQITIKFADEYIEKLTTERLREHTELVENYESVARMVAEYNNALQEIGLLEYSPDIRSNIQRQIEEILPCIKQLQSVKDKLSLAALEVVQKRLASIGLEPFCLELHSNKTKKSLVMDQLRKTTEVVQQMGEVSHYQKMYLRIYYYSS